MLFLVFGSSAAGKTSVLEALRGRVPDLALHDSDEIAVPADADTGWRHGSNREWVERALACQREGIDLLLAGQTPLGELLATPAAAQLDAISGCLLDCDDVTRVRRMRSRGPAWVDGPGIDLMTFLSWAAWLRVHAVDPTFRPDVITSADVRGELAWSRWSDWAEGDPRWRVERIDTSALTVTQTADALVRWVESERTLCRAGEHPLARAAAWFS